MSIFDSRFNTLSQKPLEYSLEIMRPELEYGMRFTGLFYALLVIISQALWEADITLRRLVFVWLHWLSSDLKAVARFPSSSQIAAKYSLLFQAETHTCTASTKM